MWRVIICAVIPLFLLIAMVQQTPVVHNSGAVNASTLNIPTQQLGPRPLQHDLQYWNRPITPYITPAELEGISTVPSQGSEHEPEKQGS